MVSDICKLYNRAQPRCDRCAAAKVVRLLLQVTSRSAQLMSGAAALGAFPHLTQLTVEWLGGRQCDGLPCWALPGSLRILRIKVRRPIFRSHWRKTAKVVDVDQWMWRRDVFSGLDQDPCASASIIALWQVHSIGEWR